MRVKAAGQYQLTCVAAVSLEAGPASAGCPIELRLHVQVGMHAPASGPRLQPRSRALPRRLRSALRRAVLHGPWGGCRRAGLNRRL